MGTAGTGMYGRLDSPLLPMRFLLSMLSSHQSREGKSREERPEFVGSVHSPGGYNFFLCYVLLHHSQYLLHTWWQLIVIIQILPSSSCLFTFLGLGPSVAFCSPENTFVP